MTITTALRNVYLPDGRLCNVEWHTSPTGSESSRAACKRSVAIQEVPRAVADRLGDEPSWKVSSSSPSKVIVKEEQEAGDEQHGLEAGRIIDARGHGLLVPRGLVHAHVHLDKCYLLDRCQIKDGTFAEALTRTAAVKADFDLEDLRRRGERLLDASISHGVTLCRAHVEVDPTVGLDCLSAGLELQRHYENRIDLRLVAFAQDPIFPADAAKQAEMHRLLREAVGRRGVSALGSTPYVEPKDENGQNHELQKKNIHFAFDLAQEAGLDVDFHLDYDLSEEPGTLWQVLELAPTRRWTVRSSGRLRRITIGHCTRLSAQPHEAASRVFERIAELSGKAGNDSIHFVALPPSDLYMMGRETSYHQLSRATIPALQMVQYGISCAFDVNNVANLFTPQGDGDPAALLPLLVALWQSATGPDLSHLLAMCTTTAALAAGADADPAFHETDANGQPTFDASTFDSAVLFDGCRTVQELVLAPPHARTTLFRGKVTSRRTVSNWLEPST